MIQVTWLIIANLSALFHDNVTTQRWNIALKFGDPSHMTSLSQSKCFISQEWSHAEIYLWNQLWVGKLLGKSWPQCKRMKQDV